MTTWDHPHHNVSAWSRCVQSPTTMELLSIQIQSVPVLPADSCAARRQCEDEQWIAFDPLEDVARGKRDIYEHMPPVAKTSHLTIIFDAVRAVWWRRVVKSAP